MGEGRSIFFFFGGGRQGGCERERRIEVIVKIIIFLLLFIYLFIFFLSFFFWGVVRSGQVRVDAGPSSGSEKWYGH